MGEMIIGKYEGFRGSVLMELRTKDDYWVNNITTTKGHRVYGPCYILINAYDDGIDVKIELKGGKDNE